MTSLSGLRLLKFTNFAEQTEPNNKVPAQLTGRTWFPQWDLQEQRQPRTGHAAKTAGSHAFESSRIRRVLNRAVQIAGYLEKAPRRCLFAGKFGQLTGAHEGCDQLAYSRSAVEDAEFSCCQGCAGSSAADCAGG